MSSEEACNPTPEQLLLHRLSEPQRSVERPSEDTDGFIVDAISHANYTIDDPNDGLRLFLAEACAEHYNSDGALECREYTVQHCG